jgi:hypothetical protein
MRKVFKKAITVELTPAEVAIVNTYQDEHGCSRMAAIRSLIRVANEELRMDKEIQLLGARVDALTARVNGMVEILQQLVSAAKDIRLGTAFSKIAIEELNRDQAAAMERIRNRYETFKR